MQGRNVYKTLAALNKKTESHGGEESNSLITRLESQDKKNKTRGVQRMANTWLEI